MKTSINFRIIWIGLLGLSTFQINAQTPSKLWARVTDGASIPKVAADGTITSSNHAFANTLNQIGVFNVTQALTNSKNPKLLEVYEFSCICEQSTLESNLRDFSDVVTGIERAPEYKALYVPNDYGIAMPEDYALNLINAQQAWDLTHSSTNTRIAISDENILPSHEEIAGKLVYYDINNTNPTDHGTAVTIIAAGNTDNGIGLSSVGFNSSVAFYQMSFNEILAATYAGIDIINISWFSGCSFSQIEQDVINEAYNNGSFIIAAAGNGTTCGDANAMVYPAAYASVFAVTSIGNDDSHEEIHGDPNTTHQHNYRVDLSAPGYNVAISPNPSTYVTASGSSYAAPYVSGTVALMLSANPCLNNQDIEQILINSADNINAQNPSYIGLIGAGRLNTGNAVGLAMNYGNSLSANASVVVGCNEGQGAIYINPQNGQLPYDITWSGGLNGLSNENLNSGTYAVQITDAHGCVSVSNITLLNTSPVVNGIITNVSCNGQDNGSIDITTTLGTPGFTYSWDNGAIVEDLSNLSPGLYRLDVIDANGCISSTEYNITTPDLLLVNGISSADLGNNDGSINLNILGGTPSYQFSWSNGSTTEDISNLSSGTYNVTVTDANGCINNSEFVVEDQSSNGLIENNISMNVYPNPSNGNAVVAWSNAMVTNVFVIDQQGKQLQTYEVTGIKSFSFNINTKGIYSVKLQLQNGEYITKKLVII